MRYVRLLAAFLFIAAGCGTADLSANAAVDAQKRPATSGQQSNNDLHGWRFRTGNICVQDWTGRKLSDGVKVAASAWSRADDINLYVRSNCRAAGFKQAQTVTVMTYAWDTYYGECERYYVWTQHGYRQPGLITRAVVHVNAACNTYAVEDRAGLVAKALGHPLGLSARTPGSPGSVMSSAWLPTAGDLQRIEQVYPW